MNRFLLVIPLVFFSIGIKAQNIVPEVAAAQISQGFKLDGFLDEPTWQKANVISNFRMVEPYDNSDPSFRTEVRILVDSKNLYLGVKCFDPDLDKMVVFSKARDSDLDDEDYIKFVFDTYGDGRSAYIFAINAFASRYDALASNRGESEDRSWDAVWEAKTQILPDGWTAEIRIPVNSLTFRKGLNTWGFNVERRIQRLLEVNRWTAISRDYQLAQTIHAGHLNSLPDFNLGIGLVAKASTMLDWKQSVGVDGKLKWDNSLDLTQRITPDITAQLTINTDFAETEVDTRRTNLTRFSLMFPEKRQFFLEGSDIYDFGFGLGHSMLAFQSRKIGLVKGQAVPLQLGGKVNGKLGNTQFGGIVARTGMVEDLAPASTMGVVRIKQNILKESNIGMIGMIGDPMGRTGSWTAGMDFTYQNSEFMGDKNFIFGAWGLMADRDGLEGDRTGLGFKIDYPNDLLDMSLTYYRLGESFDPSLGFVPRKGISYYRLGADYMPRPEKWNIRKFIFESSFSLYTDLDNQWESYRIFTAPIHFALESGDRFEFNVIPAGEFLKVPFDIADGVTIPEGSYHYNRYRLEWEAASKRKISGQATWWFGGFYGGSLQQIELEVNWRPFGFLIFEGSYERNIGHLSYGDFTQDLYGVRVQLNMSSNLNFSSFVQYDTESRSFGTNNRFRWTFAPRGELFIVYNHNMAKPIEERFWLYQSNQLIVKLVYGIGI
ncbi:MAG: carbohydrate binding family 9 domain-containing protein [Bacteroidales bacterium]|nr:carbohydrate binding family 9 domain-containing protein [Bacteroidales bacterium]